MSTQAVNPFTGQASNQATSIPVPEFLRDWGFRLQESMLDAARIVSGGSEGSGSGEGSLAAFWVAVGIAVLFGIVHIIGPGHGKLFTIGYFGSRRANLREGLSLSALVNILDSLSALLLVGIAYGILSVSLRAAGAEVGRITRMVAYAAVTLLAAGHLIGHLRGSRHHHHAHHHNHHHGRPKGELRPWMLALSVGLIPCPVSSAILAWGIVNQATGFAIILVAAVSMGDMIAMTAFSFLIIGGKRGFTALMEKRGFEKGLRIFETASMIFLMAVGILLFASVL